MIDRLLAEVPERHYIASLAAVAMLGDEHLIVTPTPVDNAGEDPAAGISSGESLPSWRNHVLLARTVRASRTDMVITELRRPADAEHHHGG